MKKLFLLLLVLLTVNPIFARDKFPYTYQGKTLEYFLYDEYEGEECYVVSGANKNITGNVIIPSKITHNGKTYPVRAIFEYAFAECSGITSVSIPNSVTEIGEGAFALCSKLTSITLPDSLQWIPRKFCGGCSSLKSVTIPNSVTEIGENAFVNCTNLTSIILPDSIKRIPEGFCSMKRLARSIAEELPETDDKLAMQKAVTKALANRVHLTSVKIPNSVTEIDRGTFDFCVNLTAIDLPNSVTEIEGFNFCTGLTSIDLPNSVTKLNGFDGCTGLTSIDLPNSVTEIWGFNFCTGLTSLDLPNSVTKILGFDFCTGLTSVDLPNSVTVISGFKGCTGLTSITIPSSVTEIGYMLFDGDTNLKTVRISKLINDDTKKKLEERIKDVNENRAGNPIQIVYF